MLRLEQFILKKSLKNLTKQLSRFLSIQNAPGLIKNVSTNESDSHLWINSPHQDIRDLPENVIIPELLQANMGKWGDAVAFECGITGRKYTHDQVFKMSRSFAAALLNSGLKRGDVVGIVLQNVPEYCPVLFGIWNANLIASPANPMYTSDEIKRQLKSSGAKCAITTPNFLPTIRSALESGECPDLKSIIVIGEAHEGCHTFFEMIKTNTLGVEFLNGSKIDTKSEVALLPYSSGTTGPPKGVMLTHYNLCINLLQRAHPGISTSERFEGGNEQERFIGVIPFFHMAGLAAFMHLGMYFGSHSVCLPQFKPATFINSIRKHKPTALHLAPPLISFIVNSPELGPEELKSARAISGGSAPVGKSLIEGLMVKAKNDFIFQEGYGMSELSPYSHYVPPLKPNTKIGSCGANVPNTISKIIDVATGKTLGRNEEGELCVQGPQVMKGYFNNEEATRNTIDENGWLHTGDIANCDEDGYFYIVDRLKELIKVKGFQVAPSELEDLLRKHPDINDVAVIGIPNVETGELPRAYIVPRKDSSLKAEDVNMYLKDKVISYKHLKGGIEFRDAIPKAPSGKILRRELKEEFKRNTK